LLDVLPDDTVAPTDDETTAGDLADSVDGALSDLPKREENVLRLYFGFEGDPMTLEAIGDKLGVTRERVRQMKEKALWRIRTSKRLRALASLRER
jgi:RNA polymerase primary sigma factor